MSRSPPGRLSFFLDGMHISSGVSFEIIRPEEVEAAEVAGPPSRLEARKLRPLG